MIFDHLPIGDSIKPFLPMVAESLGFKGATVDFLNSIYDLLINLANNKKYKTLGEVLTDPDVFELWNRFNNKGVNNVNASEDIIDVESYIIPAKNQKDDGSYSRARIKTVRCPHCSKNFFTEE